MAEAVNRSLQRGLQLLELLSEHPEGMELHEICKALDLPKSSGHNPVSYTHLARLSMALPKSVRL